MFKKGRREEEREWECSSEAEHLFEALRPICSTVEKEGVAWYEVYTRNSGKLRKKCGNFEPNLGNLAASNKKQKQKQQQRKNTGLRNVTQCEGPGFIS